MRAYGLGFGQGGGVAELAEERTAGGKLGGADALWDHKVTRSGGEGFEPLLTPRVGAGTSTACAAGSRIWSSASVPSKASPRTKKSRGRPGLFLRSARGNTATPYPSAGVRTSARRG